MKAWKGSQKEFGQAFWFMFKSIMTAAILMAALFGCGATARVIDYGHMKTDVAMSESIFLTPTDAPKTIFLQIRNTSSNQQITPFFESVIVNGIRTKGYEISQPKKATYILQANVRYLGEWRQGMNFEGTLTGAGIGALAGLGIGAGAGGPHHRAGGAAIGAGVGGMIGAGVGFAADMATRVRAEIIVIEFQITERLSEEEDITGQQLEKREHIMQKKVMGAIGTVPDAPTSKSTTKQVTSSKPGTKIYTAGVAARAAQVNLNVDQATQILIETAGRQISGIF
jgi:hypothetical protein